MKKKTWLWIAAIAIVVIIIIASSGGSDAITTADEVTDTQKEWVEVFSFNGAGDKKSSEFTYNGGKLRMRYDFQADDVGAFAAYVVKEGVDIMEEGGVPEVMLSNSENGESNLSHLSKGNYYLNVMSANGKWTIVIEELK